MSGAHSISTRRAYGVQRVCRVWARPRSSVYARRQTPRDCTLGPRRGPVGAAPDEVLVVHIRRVLEGRCCMNTRCGWGGVARTSRDPPQEPHYGDAVEGSSQV